MFNIGKNFNKIKEKQRKKYKEEILLILFEIMSPQYYYFHPIIVSLNELQTYCGITFHLWLHIIIMSLLPFQYIEIEGIFSFIQLMLILQSSRVSIQNVY